MTVKNIAAGRKFKWRYFRISFKILRCYTPPSKPNIPSSIPFLFLRKASNRLGRLSNVTLQVLEFNLQKHTGPRNSAQIKLIKTHKKSKIEIDTVL